MGKHEVRNQKQTGFDSSYLLLLAGERVQQISRRQMGRAFSIPEVAGMLIFITALHQHHCFSTLAACSTVLITVCVSVQKDFSQSAILYDTGLTR